VIIGVPKEMKSNEKRVAITPAGVTTLTNNGHEVLIETNAGIGSGFTDEIYENAGARIVETAQEAWVCEMVIKVKEPILQEYQYFRNGLILFTYLHLAPVPELTKALMENKVVAIGYETIQLEDGSLPLLTPMSEVAGRMSVQVGAQFLENSRGGKGILLGGVPGVEQAEVVIIGGGIVGTNAAKMAIGLGASVTILDVNPSRLRYLDNLFNGRVKTVVSNPYNVAESVKKADLLIGAVLIPGAKAPQIVTEEMVKDMQPGSVIIDVAIDQGGSIETIDRITTHSYPTYEKYGVIHYAVANMPGAVARTATFALTNATLPYALQIANEGYVEAVKNNPALAKGVNVVNGYITNKPVAEANGFSYIEVDKAVDQVMENIF
jgi:alanine dehydrogenase